MKRTLSKTCLHGSFKENPNLRKFFLEDIFETLEDIYIFHYKQVLADVLPDMCSEKFHQITRKTPVTKHCFSKILDQYQLILLGKICVGEISVID